MKRVAIAVVLVALSGPAYADPPGGLVAANAAIAKVLGYGTYALCKAATWSYALKSYSGTNATNDPSMCVLP